MHGQLNNVSHSLMTVCNLTQKIFLKQLLTANSNDLTLLGVRGEAPEIGGLEAEPQKMNTFAYMIAICLQFCTSSLRLQTKLVLSALPLNPLYLTI